MLRCAYGCGPIPTSRKGYFENHNALEVMESYHDLISGDALHAWRKEAGRDCVMVLDANRWLTLDPMDERSEGPEGLPLNELGMLRVTDANRTIWQRVDAQARALHANIVLLRTPASFTPSSENRKNLERFRREVIGTVPYEVAWEARGLWDAEEVDEIAAANDLIVARDPYSEFELLDPPAANVIYILTQPRGRRNFDRDDFTEFLDYLEEHEGEVTVIFRGAERKRNAYAFGVELQRSQAMDAIVGAGFDLGEALDEAADYDSDDEDEGDDEA